MHYTLSRSLFVICILLADWASFNSNSDFVRHLRLNPRSLIAEVSLSYMGDSQLRLNEPFLFRGPNWILLLLFTAIAVLAITHDPDVAEKSCRLPETCCDLPQLV